MRRLSLASLLSVPLLMGWVGAASATHTLSDTCYGQSIDSPGTDGNDYLSAGTGADVVALGASNFGGPTLEDYGFAFGGADRICGNGDKDWLYGYDGNDRIAGQGGENNLFGDDGDDIIDGGSSGYQQMLGQHGDDSLTGGDDSDSLHGGIGADTLNAGPGSDWLSDGQGFDVVNGNSGVTDTWKMCDDSGLSDNWSSIEAFLGPSEGYC